MSTIGIVVVTVVVGMMSWMSYIMFKAQKLKGDVIPKTTAKIDDLVSNNNKALLYFYSPNCGQCVGITPIIDEMKSKALAVEKVDISKNIDIAQTLNVRATPTILLIKKSKIEQIILGAKSKSYIEGLLS